MCLDFVIELSEGLAKPGAAENVSQAGPCTSAINRLTARHFIRYLPATASRQHAQKICKVCSMTAQVTRENSNIKPLVKKSQFYCPDCDVALCADPCFAKFHTKNVYWSSN